MQPRNEIDKRYRAVTSRVGAEIEGDRLVIPQTLGVAVLVKVEFFMERDPKFSSAPIFRLSQHAPGEPHLGLHL
jgi:hypothetical protein